MKIDNVLMSEEEVEKLIRTMRKNRNSHKSAAKLIQELRNEIYKERNSARKAKKSRDTWREKYLELNRRVLALTKELT